MRLKLIDSEQHMLGIAEDVTQEMVEKQKIEYERDYDLLTNLLNRRAFHSRIEVAVSEPRPDEGCGSDYDGSG